MKQIPQTAPSGATGRTYDSVSALMGGEGMSQGTQSKVAQLASETQITLFLAQLRQASGKTQKQMADALGISQSAVSKLEAGRDGDLTIHQITEYARVTGEPIGFRCGKPMTHAEAIKMHAAGLKHRLEALAGLATQHSDLQAEIKGFLGEAFFNLFNIMTLCSEQLPKGENDIDIRIEVVQCSQTPKVAAYKIKATEDSGHLQAA
jgi:transcriptional regulator with XRE-family HTH domain